MPRLRVYGPLLILLILCIISTRAYADTDLGIMPYSDIDIGEGLGEQIKKYGGYVALSDSKDMLLENCSLIKFQFTSEAELPVNSTYMILVYDTDYRMLNISITRLSQFYLFNIKSALDSDRFAVEKIGDVSFIVDEVKFVLSFRTVQHNVNFSKVKVELKGVKDAKGFIRITINEGTIIKAEFFPSKIPAPPVDPFGWLSFVGGIFGTFWASFNVVISTALKIFSVVWAIGSYIMSFVSIGFAVFYEYAIVRGYLPLFLGVYFFGTLASAIAMIPKRGFEAFVWWAGLWYKHITAIYGFFKFLTNLAMWLINFILKLIDIITGPFT